MSIDFIIPNLIEEKLEKGLRVTGYNNIDFDSLKREMRTLFNKENQKRDVEKLYSNLIPTELAVCIASTRESNELLKRHGVRIDSVELGAGVGIDLDSEKIVLLLTEEHYHNTTIIQHELVHYEQIKKGYLVYNGDESISWTKPGEEMTINVNEDLLKRKEFTDIQEYLAYEFQKPWELEAYALTMTRWDKVNLSEENKRRIDEYLQAR